MPSTYRIYSIDSAPASDDAKAGRDALVYMGQAQGASAAGAARAFFAANGKKAPPARIAVIPARAVHELAPSIETQTRLRLA